jgi:hypothetical protein
MKIPCMDLLYAIHAVKDNNTSVVSLMMTLDAFKEYILATNVAIEQHPGKKSSLPPADISSLDNRISSDTESIVDESSANSNSDALLIKEAKVRFYEIYAEQFKKMTNSTLIMQERYNTIVKVLLAHHSVQKGQQMPKFDRDCLKNTY